MATSLEFIDYVCDQIQGVGAVRYRKMFGEYMIYVNDKPILLVCNATVYIRPHACIADMLEQAAKGIPYKGAKEQYILDIDKADLSQEIIRRLEAMTPVPKPRKKKL